MGRCVVNGWREKGEHEISGWWVDWKMVRRKKGKEEKEERMAGRMDGWVGRRADG